MNGKTFSVKKQRLRYVVSDLLMTNLAFFFFNVFRYCRFGWHSLYIQDIPGYLGELKILLEQAFIPLGIMAIYWLSGFYNHPYHKSRLNELIQTALSSAFATFILVILLLSNDMTKSIGMNLTMPTVFFCILLLTVYAGRFLLTSLSIHNFKKSNWTFSTLIIGNSAKARKLADNLKSSDVKFGYDVIGFVELPEEHNFSEGSDIPVFRMVDIDNLCRKRNVMQFIICPETYNDKMILSVLNRLFHFGLPVKIVPDVLSFVTSSIHLDDIYGEPFVDLTSPRLADWKINVKRSFDVIVSACFMLFFSPLYLALAIGVKLSSPGPVIYSQERIGRMQRPFKIYKFRSMVVDAESNGPLLSGDNDPRVTRFGRFLRKYRLDEIPQFLNVFKGDMSIVGPRPERMYYIRQIIRIAPYFSLVFQVRPGITSWGMVKYGYASNLGEMIKRTKYDLIYISNMSLSIDIKILIYTVKTIFEGLGK